MHYIYHSLDDLFRDLQMMKYIIMLQILIWSLRLRRWYLLSVDDSEEQFQSLIKFEGIVLERADILETLINQNIERQA